MRLKNILKYLVAALVVLTIAYNSVYFKKLDEVKSANNTFDAVGYAQSFWSDRLIPELNKAVDINNLLVMLKDNSEQAFKLHSNALGIGNLKYFLVKGEGEVLSINEDDVKLKIDSSAEPVTLETEYVFGNAVRDASGLINMNEFDNTMDFNNVSAQINKIIKTNVLPPFLNQVKSGNRVQFIGAIEMNEVHPKLNNVEIIPIGLQVIN